MRKLRFYSRLALLNIKTNRKFYIPYILTGMGTSLMLYIMLFLQNNDGLAGSFGGRTVVTFLQFGFYIIVIFSAVVLFYTNSFLMKRRKNELGLYIILGMEKRHLGGVQLFESLFTGLVSIGGGIALGIGFSRLTLSLLTRMAHINTPLRFSVDLTATLMTLAIFLAIYLVIFLFNLMVVGRAKPIELLKGSAVGEKEPKTKWVLTVLGILALGGGYAIAILTENPLSAILLFFVAVVLVIAGTYLLLTSGSITVLKSLRGRKNYYYKTNHFINVSGMIYRMKQNAVGLANICILSTMVLVMVSTTVALNVGVEDILNERYPGEIVITCASPSDAVIEKSAGAARDFASAQGVELAKLDYTHALSFNAYLEGSEFVLDPVISNTSDSSVITVVSSDEYSRKTGKDVSLSDGQALIHTKGISLPGSFTLMGVELQSAGEAADFPVDNELEGYMPGYMRLVLSPGDFVRVLETCESGEQYYYQDSFELYIDTAGLSDEQVQKFASALEEHLEASLTEEYIDEDGNTRNASFNGMYYRIRSSEAENLYSMYGGFLFLGLSLGLLFMMATILIIYYKQITEGYNDRQRYIIMQKIGLSKPEIKKSIRGQILTVFFLPLAVSVVHVCFAFSIIRKLLAVLYMTNVTLYALCTAGAIAVFALIYLIIYLLTAREYYKIVSQ